jgi:hypothetical protein
MSENVDFNERWPDPDTASEWSSEILSELKWAIGTFDEPMHWRSSDGLIMIEAEPIQFSADQPEEPVPYGKLREMPVFRLAETMNLWGIRRTTVRPDEATVMQERFLLHAGRIIGVSAVGSIAVFEQTTQGEFARNALEYDMAQALTDPQPATVRDYANLYDAVHDLRPVADKKRDDYYEYLKNMTKEDMRNYRAMKRDWIIQPELDKKAVPKWWGITNVNQVWLVKASSPEEAVLDLEDYFDMRLEPLFMVFTDPYDDDIQEELVAKYPDNNIRQLIPFSIVEWPKDPNNMSDEQQAAFDKLRTFNDRS